jgi:hypothetical protein
MFSQKVFDPMFFMSFSRLVRLSKKYIPWNPLPDGPQPTFHRQILASVRGTQVMQVMFHAL